MSSRCPVRRPAQVGTTSGTRTAHGNRPACSKRGLLGSVAHTDIAFSCPTLGRQSAATWRLPTIQGRTSKRGPKPIANFDAKAKMPRHGNKQVGHRMKGFMKSAADKRGATGACGACPVNGMYARLDHGPFFLFFRFAALRPSHRHGDKRFAHQGRGGSLQHTTFTASTTTACASCRCARLGGPTGCPTPRTFHSLGISKCRRR